MDWLASSTILWTQQCLPKDQMGGKKTRFTHFHLEIGFLASYWVENSLPPGCLELWYFRGVIFSRCSLNYSQSELPIASYPPKCIWSHLLHRSLFQAFIFFWLHKSRWEQATLCSSRMRGCTQAVPEHTQAENPLSCSLDRNLFT